MEPTHLVYLDDMTALSTTAVVVLVEEREGKMVVILDQTVFYPQGGGQPYDQGYIRSEKVVYRVDEVRFLDGVVLHIGAFENGMFSPGAEVACAVHPERRALHARLHSGGHVVDLALLQFPHIHWKPGKGYHFPQGPYIEYHGELEEAGDIELFRKSLEEKANITIQRNDAVVVRFMPKSEMHTVCHVVPEYLPEGKPTRVVMYGTQGIPCGGTHVAALGHVGHITIRKIKKEKDAIRVSYSIV